MKIRIFSSFSLLLMLAWAALVSAPVARAQYFAPTQELERQFRPPIWEQGRLVSLQIYPASSEVKFYVVGVEPQRMALSDVGISAYIRAGEDFVPITLRQDQQNPNAFSVDVPPDVTSSLKLDVKYQGKVETFNVNVGP